MPVLPALPPAAVASVQSEYGRSRGWSAHPAVVEAALPEQFLFALGDLHGDYEHAVKLLENAGVIEKLAPGADPSRVVWKAGKATLVCTGDMIDKGKRSLDVLRLLMS